MKSNVERRIESLEELLARRKPRRMVDVTEVFERVWGDEGEDERVLVDEETLATAAFIYGGYLTA